MKKSSKLLTIITALSLIATSCSFRLSPGSATSRKSKSSSDSGESSGSSSSSSQPRNYSVIWKNYDGTVLEMDRSVPEGDTPTYDGIQPTKPSDAQYSYTFSGWTPTVVPANADAEYTATFDTEVRKYTVLWKNYDDTIIETDENVPYGTTPTFNGENPSKPDTVSKTYKFDGWTPEISEVTGDVSYTAKFKEETRKYTITWKNYNGNELKIEQVEYGTLPSYTGDAPTKESTTEYDYAFSGWSPSIIAVEGDAEYTATFEQTVRKYNITWKNYNGDVIKTDQVTYGTLPVYEGDLPEKESDMEYNYIFDGWNPEVVNVTGDAEYIAKFRQETRTYTVRWVNYDGTILETDENVPYGTTPTYNGSTPTKVDDHGIKYTFSGWTPTIVPIYCDVTYTAKYNSTAYFSFETIPYEMNSGYQLSDVRGAPWINLNLQGEVDKIKRPSLKDDFYAYVNYDAIKTGSSGGPFNVSDANVQTAMNNLFSGITTNGSFHNTFYSRINNGDTSHIKTYLNSIDAETYLESKECFGSTTSLLRIVPNGDDGYEVEYNDGYMNGVISLPTLFLYESVYDGLDTVDDSIVNGLYSALNISFSSDDLDDVRNYEGGMSYVPYRDYNSGYTDSTTYTVSTLPWDEMKSALTDLGLASNAKITINDYYENAFNYLYDSYLAGYPETVEKVIRTRLAFDYRFMLGYTNYMSINQYIASTRMFSSDETYMSYYGSSLARKIMARLALPYVTEQSYIELGSTEAIKATVAGLIEDVLQGYKDLVNDMDWLSSTTKDGIRRKLNHMTYESCYSDYFKNFPALDTTNMNSKSLFELYARYSDKMLVQAKNRQIEKDSSWSSMPSWTVNAYYSPGANKFVILNGVVSGFLSDTTEELYGMLGFVIGHEITHAFDSSGSQYDEYGRQSDWWASADKTKFNNKVNKLINFMNKIDQYDGHYVNGDNVDGEATADMGGIRVMLKLAEKIDNFDYDLFFRTCAYTWLTYPCSDGDMARRITDAHPVNYLRTNVTQTFLDQQYF